MATPDTEVDGIHYGPDIPTETELRLLGDVRGKRVLDLGCGPVPAAITLAHQGAVAMAVAIDEDEAAAARRRCEEEGVRVDLHHGDLADLPFLRSESVDVVLSVGALSHVEDLNRVFRQVHRVLKTSAPFVFSVRHPAYATVDDSTQPAVVRRSYFDTSPRPGDGDGSRAIYQHTIADLYSGLTRAGYRVDALLEPEPVPAGPRSQEWRDTFRFVPRTLVVRARKEGA